MSTREVALQKRIDEIGTAISPLLDGAQVLMHMAVDKTPTLTSSNADGFCRAVAWVAGHLADDAQRAFRLTDYVVNPLDDEEEASV